MFFAMRTVKGRCGLIGLGLLLAGMGLLTGISPCVAQAQTPAETPEQFAKRMKWWREARFGMFIHWGVYSVPAGVWKGKEVPGIGEWIMDSAHIPVAEYETLPPQFNPVQFNADEWVRIAKDAGMKYIVITSKHHDGFCMFDSKLTDYTIVKATPFKRDPLQELAVACRKQGIKLCFYHSIMDWHHPDAKGERFPKYVEHLRGQLKELVTRYGPLGVLWFDGEWIGEWTNALGEETYNYLRQLQPSLIINNRVGKGREGMAGRTAKGHFAGDFGTPEQEIPATGMAGEEWESCMTMNDTWGFKQSDHNWKPTPQLIRMLIDTASKGGNLLLNVGPTSQGLIPEASVERLRAMGAWMKVNRESIYATSASPFKRLPFNGRCTRKGNNLYLHVFEWPAEGLTLTGLQTPVREVVALQGGERLQVQTETDKNGMTVVRIAKPSHLDPIATVLRVKLAGPPVVAEAVQRLRPNASGAFVLKAAEAEVHGQSARYESGGGKDNIGFWTRVEDYVTWAVQIPQGGRYRVEIVSACEAGSEGSRFTLGVDGGANLTGTVKATGSWSAFQMTGLGELMLPAGPQTLAVRVQEKPRYAVMNLREVRLIPLP